MIEWIPVTDSSRVIAVAYSHELEQIYVRFRSEVEWCYEGCPPHIWETFIAPNTSMGAYIHEELDRHDHHRFDG